MDPRGAERSTRWIRTCTLIAASLGLPPLIACHAVASLPPRAEQIASETASMPVRGLSQTQETSPPPQGSPGSVAENLFQQLKFYGDLRLRYEGTFDTGDGDDRHRERLRFRLGLNYQLTDELLLGTRVVTGDPDDPNSPHVTFGDDFDGLDLSLDRAFLRYRPAGLPGAFLTAGKFDHALARNPVYGELVWDADVQPEGLVLGRTFDELGMLESWRFLLGGYTLLEQSAAKDAFVFVSELGGRVRMGEQTTSDVALSYYGYSDVDPDGSTAILADNAGNATVDLDADGEPDEFISEFGILNALASVTHAGGSRPVTFAAEYMKNLDAEIDRDEGWALGASIGGGRGDDWRLYYQWQVVEQDAVFSAFAQDDFPFTTNHRSHVLGVRRRLTEGVALHLWGLISSSEEQLGSGLQDDPWRVRLDLDVKL